MDSVFNKFFYPAKICVVGASSKPKSLGYELTKSIIEFGFNGKILLVNPNSDEVLGIRCHKKISDIKDEIDLAIVMVPKLFVEETLRELLEKNVSAIILITAGFKETGESGAEAEKRIINLIRDSNARLVGPNCMGIINTNDKVKMNATFVAEQPRSGTIAFCSQSGAIGAAILNSLRETDIRFGHFISVGNKADVNELDLLKYWNSNSDIKVLCFYLESFVDGESLINYLIDNGINKPIIILKAGRTKSGIKAASSHTGAIATSDKIVDAVLNQFGIIRVDDLNDMFNTAKGFEEFPIPKGKKVAIVTNAGGPAILTVDSLERNRLLLSELSENTKLKLKSIVHPEGSINNPVDLLPGGTSEQFKSVIEILSEDENVDSIISIFVEPIMVKAFEVVEKINDIQSSKPIFQIVMPLPEFWNEYYQNSKSRKPLFRFPEDVAVVIKNILTFNKLKSNSIRLKSNLNNQKVNLTSFNDKFLPQQLVIKLLEKYSIPLIEQNLINLNDIGNLELKFPLVLKATNEVIIHKSDLNAVIVDIKNQNEFTIALENLKNNLNKRGILLESLIIQPFIKPKFEILIGAFRDQNFGPMIMFGSGGKYVEFIDDNSMCSAYLNDEDIDLLINSTKIGKIIKGVRGETSADIEKIKFILRNIAQIMLDYQEIKEVDLNPVIISENNEIYCVDVRIKC